MPAVFVHGVPDTAGLWGPLLGHLSRDDVVAVTLPGFGCATPTDFNATKEDYVDWLIGELEKIGEPVDLVGHDWGAILVQRVAAVRTDLVKTLASGSGPLDEEYEWHAMAQAWQQQEVGEQIFSALLAQPSEARAEMFVAGGATSDLAASQAEHLDERMGRCILSLYRSAVTVGAEWQASVEAMDQRPTLVMWGADDPYCPPRFAERQAERTSARLVVFDECSHWWPSERAQETALALEQLWTTV